MQSEPLIPHGNLSCIRSWCRREAERSPGGRRGDPLLNSAVSRIECDSGCGWRRTSKTHGVKTLCQRVPNMKCPKSLSQQSHKQKGKNRVLPLKRIGQVPIRSNNRRSSTDTFTSNLPAPDVQAAVPLCWSKCNRPCYGCCVRCGILSHSSKCRGSACRVPSFALRDLQNDQIFWLSLYMKEP